MGIKPYSDSLSKTKLLPAQKARIRQLHLKMRAFEAKHRKACRDIPKSTMARYHKWCREVADIYEPIFRENRRFL